MRIVCPACAASYDVPDALLGEGRSVRCVRCLREWQPAHPATPVVADLPPATPVVADLPIEEPPAWHDAGPPPALAFAAPDHTDFFEVPDEVRPQFGDQESAARAPAALSTPHLSVASQSSGGRRAWRDALLVPEGEPYVRRAERGDGWIGWVASLVLLAALVWAAIAYRAEVQRAWPPSTRLYTALGLYVPP